MKFWRILLLVLLLSVPVPGILGQGCSLCRDTTAGSAPQVRKSLRMAIPILAIPAVGLFTLVLYLSMANNNKDQ
jgi:hypothetical protein